MRESFARSDPALVVGAEEREARADDAAQLMPCTGGVPVIDEALRGEQRILVTRCRLDVGHLRGERCRVVIAAEVDRAVRVLRPLMLARAGRGVRVEAGPVTGRRVAVRAVLAPVVQ
jgi:hypothetical protein